MIRQITAPASSDSSVPSLERSSYSFAEISARSFVELSVRGVESSFAVQARSKVVCPMFLYQCSLI